MRLILALILALILPGCGLLQRGGPDERQLLSQPSQIQLLPTIELTRPVLEIHTLTEPAHADEVVKAYVASVYQLLRYSESLEEIVHQLQQLHIENYAP